MPDSHTVQGDLIALSTHIASQVFYAQYVTCTVERWYILHCNCVDVAVVWRGLYVFLLCFCCCCFLFVGYLFNPYCWFFRSNVWFLAVFSLL